MALLRSVTSSLDTMLRGPATTLRTGTNLASCREGAIDSVTDCLWQHSQLFRSTGMLEKIAKYVLNDEFPAKQVLFCASPSLEDLPAVLSPLGGPFVLLIAADASSNRNLIREDFALLIGNRLSIYREGVRRVISHPV